MQEVAALPVVVPLAAVALVVLLWRLHRRGALSVPRVLVGVAACVYGAGVVANTVFPVHLGRTPSGLPWWTRFHLTPLAGTEWFDMALNVVVFAPLGVLLPLLARVGSARGVLLRGFLVGLAMEVVHFLNALTGSGGHVADVNDLLANTLGAPIGYGLFRLALLVPALARLAAAATWPPPSRHERQRQARAAS